MQSQLKRAGSPKVSNRRAARPEYTAAVRYLDGRSDIFHVRIADDIDDARALMLSELGKVRSLVIALRRR